MIENNYQLEKSINEEIYNKLIKIGHKVKFTDETIGGGQAIFLHRDKGTLIAGSDPRKDGCAIGY